MFAFARHVRKIIRIYERTLRAVTHRRIVKNCQAWRTAHGKNIGWAQRGGGDILGRMAAPENIVIAYTIAQQ